jgi:WD40 repeat protein
VETKPYACGIWRRAKRWGPLRGHESAVYAVAVTEHEGGRRLIVSGSRDKTLRVWDLETCKAVGEPLRGHKLSVDALAVTEHRGRRLIVSGSSDKTLRVWDLETGKAVGEPLQGHESYVSAVAVTEHRGRSLVVSGSRDRTVRVWDLGSGRPVLKIEFDSAIRSLTALGACVCVGCISGLLLRIDLGRL